MSIELQQISKHFGEFTALRATDLTIQDGEMVALLGPSGSGKTTLLRMIAGLESADSGHVLINGKDVTHTPVKNRHIGFVFQHYALFKHMKVIDNVAFGLSILPRRMRPSKAEQRAKAQQLLDMVQLAHLADRYPASLSGGQQQRVALARALATEPTVVLFDEPFGALDVKVRRDLRLWLKELQRKLGFTGVFVTHDQEEALDLADRICVMRQGEIMQTASADELYQSPNSADVFRFMSDVHEWPVTAAGQMLDLGSKSGNAWVKVDKPIPAGKGTLAIRNQELALSPRPESGVMLPVKIVRVDMLGTQYRLSVANENWGDSAPWHVLLPVQSLAGHLPEVGKRYYFAPRQAYFLSEDGKLVLPLLHEFNGLKQG